MTRPPADSLNVVSVLRQFNLRPDKRLGQNFLADETALGKVARAAELTPDDAVLEIGAGAGSLTRWLATNAGRVVAVEIDDRLRPALEQALRPYPNVRLVFGDIMALDPAALMGTGEPYTVVANIPYYITSALIRHLLEAETRPTRLVLTVQREVAERIVAAPGDMSLLAVSVQFYGRPSIAATIPAGAFYPRPEVDSAVVRIEVYSTPPVAVGDVDRFFEVVRAGFSQKRKQLRNSIAGGLGISAKEADARLRAAGLDASRRAETLSLAEWGEVVREFGSSGVGRLGS